MIGITVVTPFILILFTHRRIRVVTWEMLGPLALIVAALWLTMRYVELVHFPLFYLLFIPVIWSAIRFGLEGVVFGLAVTQIGLIAAIHLSPSDAIDVTAFQALMIVLAVTGLAVGLLVNEQQRTEQQLRVQQDAIARVIRVGSMGEFAAALAHEINQPLMAIANYTKLAKEVAEKTPVDTATVAEASGKAAEQVERAAAVVRRLREFIRLGRSEVVAVPVAQVIAQARQFCEADLERHGIVLDVDAPASLTGRACRHSADPAGHHQPDPQCDRCDHGGRTLRRPHLRDRRTRGRARQHLRARQRPGVRARPDRTRDRAVHQHEAGGHGARPFALPLDRGSAWRASFRSAATRPAPRSSSPCALRKWSPMPSDTIALIDDDAAVLDSLRMVLANRGMQVECFSSAESFLPRAETSPACIVSDVRMPGLSGLELQNELHARAVTTPLILITGHGDIAMAVRAIKAGAFEFIEKPFDNEVLLDAIRRAVASRAREQIAIKTRSPTGPPARANSRYASVR